jgi:hypothetical protein
MTTIENNKLMMVFLGYEEIYSPLENIFELSENETILESDLTFHSDWNQLMKVVDKIETIQFQVNILQEGCFIQRWCSYTICDKRISLVPVDTQKIDSVYMACIGFIIW